MKDNHRGTPAIIVTAVFLALFTAACGELVAPSPIAPATAAYAKGGNPAPASAGADVIQGDLLLADTDAPALASTCPPQGFTGSGWAVVFGKSGCLIVRPLWASTTYEAYALTDDVVLQVLRESNRKNARITHVKLNAQDVDGEAGIWHNTDWIAVAEPVVPSQAGFTLHVHARNVEVWRYDSHLGGGNRVEMIGTISIGDILYPAQ